MRLHPEPVVTYNVDRNINTTNVCLSLCEFCAFGRLPGEQGSWTLSREAIAAKIDELYRVSGFQRSASDGPDANPVPPPQILMQGGLSPELDLAWYEDLFRWMRGRWPDLHIHALSPPEIHHLAQEAGVGWRQVIVRLREAGLDSIPGGGAEILSSRLRRAISPRKCDVADWIGVMRAAHEEGLRTTATMVIGLGETLAERVEHLERLRLLQDETGGFTAFIVWTFQPRNTALGAKMENREHREGAASGAGAHGEAARTKGGAGGAGGHDEAACAKGGAGGAGACEYLRTLAVARLYLDNFENVQASWVTQGRDIAQLALLFGANDLGSTMLEENVVAAAGARFRLSARDLENLTLDLGFKPARRDFYYRVYA
jgi:cyclic dehypoxanthinyl futalosine synthase